jgi:hypothetical protein
MENIVLYEAIKTEVKSIRFNLLFNKMFTFALSLFELFSR